MPDSDNDADLERRAESLSVAPTDLNADTTAGTWGFGNLPWFWGVRLRILFVMDGRINITWGDDDFGLGYVLSTVRAHFAPWVRIEVVTAHRGDIEPVEIDLGFVTIEISPDLVGFGSTRTAWTSTISTRSGSSATSALDGNNPSFPDSSISTRRIGRSRRSCRCRRVDGPRRRLRDGNHGLGLVPSVPASAACAGGRMREQVPDRR
jgi:hypothetical protein